MYGLCMPTGEVYLILKDGTKKSIMLSDLVNPRKEIMESKWILDYIKHKGYKTIDAIMYERYGHKTIVPMADYYYEHASELED